MQPAGNQWQTLTGHQTSRVGEERCRNIESHHQGRQVLGRVNFAYIFNEIAPPSQYGYPVCKYRTLYRQQAKHVIKYCKKKCYYGFAMLKNYPSTQKQWH